MASILDQDFGDESDEGDFNPEVAADSGDESQPENEQSRKPTSGKQGRSPDGGSDDEEGKEDEAKDATTNGDNEDDEDDDDDDDDDEEAITRRPRKRARRDPRNQFLDVEAEVDEEDEGDEEDDEGQEAGFIADTHPDDLADLPEGAPADDRRHRELDRERERKQQLDAEEQAALLREKYGRRTTTASDAAIVPRRLLLPSVDDPSIWGVKCKPAKEREIINTITRRMEERSATRHPLPIISAFERGNSMSGYIYVEAKRQADVLSALDGIMNVYPRTKMVLVPIKEMPDLLRVTKSEQVQAGGYVRIKSGLYAGDLAQIDDVESNGLTATLKIVPRLDYGQNEGDAPMVDGGIKGDAAKRKRAGAMGLNKVAVRPPPRLFSETEAKKKHSRLLTQEGGLGRKVFKYMNKEYVNGYLIQEFKIQRLVTDNVNPTLEEVTRFTSGGEDGTENLDLSALAQTLKKGSATENYLPGDIVEVYEGEQSGVMGKAVAVRGDIVTVSVTEGDLQGQQIEVPQKGLRKRFKEGDHVKVIGGSKYRDEVGMVVQIERDTVTLLSDLSLQEITVFSKDLREASDSGIAGGLGQYDIHDLVQLDSTTVGCVTKVDRESLQVLDQHGSIRSIMPSQISNKIEKRRHAVATDRNGSEIRIDDLVREIGGEQKSGSIIHIYRSFIFIYNRELTDNSGISVVRATNVATVAAKGGRVTQTGSTGPDLTKMNPAVMRNGANGNGGMAPPKSFGRDRALGQTVTIRRGPYKGLLGIIKDTTDNEARVELHTKGKTITVAKETLGFKDPATGQTLDYTRFATARRPPPSTFSSNLPNHRTPAADNFASSRTPLNTSSMAGGRTPAWSSSTQNGGRTPAWSAGANTGARTPAWQQPSTGGGGRTPAWSSTNDGSRTVNPYADGSRTQYGGAGGNRTPAWNPTATASSYSHDPFSGGGGGRTPAYMANGGGAGMGGARGAYDAPTPGRDYAGSAPTPGASGTTPAAMIGQTPKFSGDAPTPFASGLPETPAYSGAMDGPRYEEGTPSP